MIRESDIRNVIALLEEYQAQEAGAAPLELTAKRDALAEQLAVVDAEIAVLRDPYHALVTEIKARVEAMTLEYGKSVKGDGLQAVYIPGRETVDTPQFKGLLLAHPEYLPMLHVGKPSVSFRVVKKEAQ